MTIRRADFINDEEIQDIIRWQHPYTPKASPSHEFTEQQKVTILRLPRKECGFIVSFSYSSAIHSFISE